MTVHPDHRVGDDDWAEMRVRGLILDPQSEAPVVVLREEGESLVLPIWIGLFEANAIALALERVEPRRPMTHDLLRSTIESLGCALLRIEIHSLAEGTFFARLVLSRNGGEVLDVDARPSDAIALALRTDSPIFAARTVLDAAVASSKAAEISDEERLREWLKNAKPEELGKYPM